MNTVKCMINSMFYVTCRCLVLSNKGGKTIEEQLAELVEADIMCQLLELTIQRAHDSHDITETEYKFVLRALESAVDSEVGL